VGNRQTSGQWPVTGGRHSGGLLNLARRTGATSPGRYEAGPAGYSGETSQWPKLESASDFLRLGANVDGRKMAWRGGAWSQAMVSCDLAAIAAVGDSVAKVACRSQPFPAGRKVGCNYPLAGFFAGWKGAGNIASLQKPTISGWPKGWIQLHPCGLFRGLKGSANIASLQKPTISGWPKVWPQRRGVPARILDCPTSCTQRR
jgi:hypothetical protein